MTDIIIRSPEQSIVVTQAAPQHITVVAPTTTVTTSTNQEVVNLQEILAIIGPEGPQGPSGTGSDAVTYDLVSVSSWTQAHTLNHKPSVTILENGTDLVNMTVEYPTASSVHLNFPTPFTGQVVLQ